MDRERDRKTEISGICPDVWICHDPVFLCDAVNPDLLEFSPWSGHRRFAYDYVRNVRPAVIVELGSFYGCSAFAFQQAILDGMLDYKRGYYDQAVAKIQQACSMQPSNSEYRRALNTISNQSMAYRQQSMSRGYNGSNADDLLCSACQCYICGDCAGCW